MCLFLKEKHIVDPLKNNIRIYQKYLTVKRRLRDAGLLGRVAKKKSYLRLAKINKR